MSEKAIEEYIKESEGEPLTRASEIPTEWFSLFHSGSEAVKFARDYLEGGKPIGQLGEIEISLICSELIYRVTGEKIAPKNILINLKRGIAHNTTGGYWIL